MNEKDCIKKDMCDKECPCDICENFNKFYLKSTTNDGYNMEIDCPYCGENVIIEHDDKDTETECGSCEKMFNVSIEYDPNITATIIEDEFNRME